MLRRRGLFSKIVGSSRTLKKSRASRARGPPSWRACLIVVTPQTWYKHIQDLRSKCQLSTTEVGGLKERSLSRVVQPVPRRDTCTPKGCLTCTAGRQDTLRNASPIPDTVRQERRKRKAKRRTLPPLSVSGRSRTYTRARRTSRPYGDVFPSGNTSPFRE